MAKKAVKSNAVMTGILVNKFETGQINVADLSVFRAKKKARMGRENEHWHAAWIAGGRTRSVYLGTLKLQEDEPRGGAGEGGKGDRGERQRRGQTHCWQA